MSYYPVLLDLDGRSVIVVGGGTVAQEKVEALLETGARVTLFAESLVAPLAALRDMGRIEVRSGAPTSEDVAGAFLVLAERQGSATNAQRFAQGETLGRFVNVQDDVEHSSFIAPAVVRQGDLIVAVSTSGAAPALAVRLRQLLTRQLGKEYAAFLSLSRRYRRPLATEVSSFSERRRRWYRLVDSSVWNPLRRGDLSGAERLATRILGVAPDA